MLMVDEQVDDGFPKVDGKKVDEGMIIHIYIYIKTHRSSHVFWLCKIKLLKRDDLPSSKKFFQLTQLLIIPPEFSGHTQERALAQVYLKKFEVTCLLSGHTQDKDFQFPLVSSFLCGQTLPPFWKMLQQQGRTNANTCRVGLEFVTATRSHECKHMSRWLLIWGGGVKRGRGLKPKLW